MLKCRILPLNVPAWINATPNICLWTSVTQPILNVSQWNLQGSYRAEHYFLGCTCPVWCSTWVDSQAAPSSALSYCQFHWNRTGVKPVKGPLSASAPTAHHVYSAKSSVAVLAILKMTVSIRRNALTYYFPVYKNSWTALFSFVQIFVDCTIFPSHKQER